MSFLVASLVLSLVLTLVLNAGLAVLARRRRTREDPDRQMIRNDPRFETRSGATNRTVTTRVFFPWKLMLAISVIVTVVINLGR